MSDAPTAPATPPAAYRFGGFELRPRTRQLLCDGREVELQGKVFDLIAYLLAHADRAVDKGELFDAVWPRQIVTEAALARCVMKARRALDADAADPRVLQTVHGRGYRLVAEVTRVAQLDATGGSAADAAPTPALASAVPATSAADNISEASRPRSRGHGMRFGVLLVLATLLAGIWLLRQAEDATPPTSNLPMRLAILPARNETGDATLDWAELALIGAIGDVLQLGGGMPVVSAADVLPLRAAAETLDGEELWQRLNTSLGSSHVVRSRLLAQPGQLRLSYRLIGPDGMQRRRTVVATDVSGLAHAAGNDLLAALGWQRSGESVGDDAFANEAFLRGRALRLQGDVAGAAELFRLAIEQVPGAFWPRYELALCLRDLGESDVALQRLQSLRAEADHDASRDARLSVRNAEAILLWRSGRYEDAEALLQEALVLAEQHGDPDRLSSVLTNLGILADFRHQPDTAREYLNRASEAALAGGHPAVPGHIRHTLGQIEIDAGQYDAAEDHLDAALSQFRTLGNRRYEAIVLNTLSRLRRRQGRNDEARGLVESALAVHRELGARGAEATALQSLSSLDAGAGRLAEAMVRNEEALQVAEAIGEMPRVISAERLRGELEAGRGSWDAARDWLQRARTHASESGLDATVDRIDLDLAEVLLRADELDAAEALWSGLTERLGSDASRSLRRQHCLIGVRLQRMRTDGASARAGFDACASAFAGHLDDAMRRLDAEIALDQGDADRARALIDALAPDNDHDTSRRARLAARLAALRGDAPAALALEDQAKRLAGEHWLADDEARLAERRRAVAR